MLALCRGKRFFTKRFNNINNGIRLPDTTNGYNYNSFLEFKKDIKYIVNTNLIMLGFGITIMATGLPIFYSKIDSDKNKLEIKINENTIKINETNNKLDKLEIKINDTNNKLDKLDEKLDKLINKKSWF